MAFTLKSKIEDIPHPLPPGWKSDFHVFASGKYAGRSYVKFSNGIHENVTDVVRVLELDATDQRSACESVMRVWERYEEEISAQRTKQEEEKNEAIQFFRDYFGGALSEPVVCAVPGWRCEKCPINPWDSDEANHVVTWYDQYHRPFNHLKDIEAYWGMKLKFGEQIPDVFLAQQSTNVEPKLQERVEKKCDVPIVPTCDEKETEQAIARDDSIWDLLRNPSESNFDSTSMLRRELCEQCKLSSDDFDADFDMTYSDAASSTSRRGGEYYMPPTEGWQKLGLKVNNKYEDNDWLHKSKWPVVYHGTSAQQGVVWSIIHEGFKIRGGQDRALHGERLGVGIYCSPAIERALQYAEEPLMVDDVPYTLVFQCRVRPSKYKKLENHVWLVHDSNDIRPCGILLRQCRFTDDKGIQYVQNNPHKPGTSDWTKYEALKLVGTVREARELGRSLGGLQKDFLKGRLLLEGCSRHEVKKTSGYEKIAKQSKRPSCLHIGHILRRLASAAIPSSVLPGGENMIKQMQIFADGKGKDKEITSGDTKCRDEKHKKNKKDKRLRDEDEQDRKYRKYKRRLTENAIDERCAKREKKSKKEKKRDKNDKKDEAVLEYDVLD